MPTPLNLPASPADALTLADYQAQVDAWVQGVGGYFTPLSQLAQLMEEVGELARALNRTHGQQSFKAGEVDNTAEEMADILFTLTCLANTLNISLAAQVDANLAKKTKRDTARHLANPKLPGHQST